MIMWKIHAVAFIAVVGVEQPKISHANEVNNISRIWK
jgi:hypothetical protein